jgi:7-cyano-7-deazaguanine synthase
LSMLDTTHVVVCSGGMDSVTLAHMVAHDHPNDHLHLISVDYGQRHRREMEYALRCARRLDADYTSVDLSGLREILGGSALTTGIEEVPEGHYSDATMSQTVVPNRNMILLSVAIGLAVSIGAEDVYTGVHAGDHPVYPDCRPEFIRAVSIAGRLGNMGTPVGPPLVKAPFSEMEKWEIAAVGKRVGVPFSQTWSCYKGGEVHCGRCSTCVERIEALHRADVDDRTPYLDTLYWRTVSRDDDALETRLPVDYLPLADEATAHRVAVPTYGVSGAKYMDGIDVDALADSVGAIAYEKATTRSGEQYWQRVG